MQTKNIVILNYHKISKRMDIGLTARHPDDFERDLRIFHEQGFKSVTFLDLIKAPEKLPPRALIITFDDGYRSVIEQAYPLMEQCGFKGVVYIPTDYIGKSNDWDVQFGGKKYVHLNAQELKFLADSGFEIGSHGASHRSFKAMPLRQCEDELKRSKIILEQIAQKPVVSISYPFGQFNRQILALSRNAGYRFGVGSIFYRSLASLDGLSVMALRRFNIYRSDSMRTVRKKLTADFNSIYAYRDWLIQQGSMATVLWQKVFKTKDV
ncbi:polysaccharide deacetylase [Caldithrix abyssi DSM 13497]|uniref:Peptidoglycan/xylan/chitin deacetylase, PgdA/CDA1 family n=1 Tax=Caldithrix abyssi DSM 13497 TaxID=880073 RepID=H1XXM0_CALAY|nr:polysaccharide deacetylase family protein [Caldithrix abyssi]APF19233.1 Peptidoglycan/xylan/chitin deacetylase, PgdA/CDA1 family [Caldithrix abyssi DSM 13497]EHO43144.1 polysaccharide deacetylase [Caldithrix abyssi DSM 13497]